MNESELKAVRAPTQLSNLTLSKYPIALMYLSILQTCSSQRSIYSCRYYINGTDKWNHLFTEFKQNCPNNNKPQQTLLNVTLIEDCFSAAKALWLIIRFSLSEIPSSGCDSSFTLRVQFVQIYNNDLHSIISTSF